MEELRLKIGKMTCVNCSNAIERACKKLDGVEDASVSYVNSSGVFLLKDMQKRKDIIAKIENLGFEILEDEQSLIEYKIKKHLQLRKNLLLSVVLGTIIMYFEMFVKNSFSQNIQMLLSVFGIFYCGRDFFFHAFLGIKNKHLDMNTLVALGTLSAFVYSFLVYLGIFNAKDLYFSGAMMIIIFVLLGRYFESKAKLKAQKYQDALEKIDTKKARILLENEEIKEIPSSFVKSSDVLLVKEGESIIVDGLVLKGSAELDMSFLNGEFLPVLKQEGDEVQAGSIVLNGALKIKASKKAMDSTLEQIKNLVFQASKMKSPLADLADQISKYFVASIIVFAFLVFIFWFIKADLNASFLHACAVLLISCPCALGLATPLALVVASSSAARNFVLVKNLSALERLALIKCVVFDKTGTLTKAKLSILKHNLTKDDFDKLCQIESLSSHPIAQALHQNKAFKLEGEGRVIVGCGIKYKENNDAYWVGNAQFLHENAIKTQETDAFFDSLKKYEGIRVYFAKNKECLGGVLLNSTFKKGAKELICKLKDEKLKTFILSGDHEKNVEKIAQKLQVDGFYSQVKSEDKLQRIKSYQNALFVGDGINDAAALGAAFVSMSFSKANELAKKTGDFILLKEDLKTIFFCFKLAKKTRQIIKMNLFWAFAYNTLCIPIAAGFVPFISLSPPVAALAMGLSSFSVVLNSLRLKRV
ncbi:cation-translocating P-type ATPase [Campylobacter sp. VicNov18]|uniref:heavy metal translocating P-type ATPase n=1 Tax=Campylobacter bilis TaxID=2691918 RepID=UPI00130EC01D|nr:cation-translocating P-type ATPase [Campylobacter bilis]MBM0636705.1 copper-translocating P-type ATPase [Campylobacter bilis]MCC8349860.1 cation-translocating P-type ATPase [Campylobacter bilis]MCC8355210.1 cation-translocating P-type ATPase [Campylobacter bilis]MPV63205.1 copper-translocating P-type ATPase [Campylobacter hepaticus]